MIAKKRLFIIIGLLVLLVLVAALATWFKGSQTDTYGVVVLSNGKEVYLGQSLSDLKKVTSNNLYDLKNQYYQYPGNWDAKHPLELTIFVDKNQVVSIRASKDPKSLQKKTGIHTGMSLDEVNKRTNNQAKPLAEIIRKSSAKGLVLTAPKSTSFYMVNPCRANDNNIVAFAVSLKGYEAKAKGDGAGCNSRGD